MYCVLLDENNFYTGNYSTIGKLENGIMVDELPPENSLSYKLEEEEVTETMYENVFEYVRLNALGAVEISDEEYEKMEEKDKANIVRTKKTNPDGSDVLIPREVKKMKKKWVYSEDQNKEINSLLLDEIKEKKILELSNVCKNTIYNGITIETTNGNEVFELTETDQINIKSLFDTTLISGDTPIFYHSKNSLCREFTKEEVQLLYSEAMKFVVYNTTLFNHLKIQILNMKSEDRISEITFSESSLNGKYKDGFNNIINR